MLDVSETVVEETRVVKRFRPWLDSCRPYFEAEREFAQLLSDSDLGPRVLGVGAAWIEYERGTPLSERLDPDPVRNRWAGWALLRAIWALHSLGVAHRDIQRGNLLVTPDDRIHFIDCELACRIDPVARPRPYALYGPEGSGVSPPDTHRAQKIAAFWDSESVDDAPWKFLGRLGEYA